MTNKSALFCILGVICRTFETSVTYGFITDFMKKYFDDPKPEEEHHKQIYPLVCGFASTIGPMFGNWSTYILIKMIGEENPMAIPYVCMFRMLMTLPSMYLLWLANYGFWFSMSGFILRQTLSLGYTAPTILMLQNVVDEDVKNLAIGLFSLFLDLDMSVGTAVTGYLKTEL